MHTGLAHEKRDRSKKEHDFNQLSQHFFMLKKVGFGGQCPVSKPFDSGKGEKKKKKAKVLLAFHSVSKAALTRWDHGKSACNFVEQNPLPSPLGDDCPPRLLARAVNPRGLPTLSTGCPLRVTQCGWEHPALPSQPLVLLRCPQPRWGSSKPLALLAVTSKQPIHCS